jgi:cytochrome c-type biogenesis protein CcmH/NrfG
MRLHPGFLRPSICFIFAFLLAAPFCARPRVFAGEPQWVEVRSPNFIVATDDGEKRGREVAMRFEQMRAVFGSLMDKAKVTLPVPLQIVAFRNTKEMRQVAPLWNGKPTQVAGLFQGGSDRSFIMLDMSQENPWTVVFHEYAHQLMNGNMQVQLDPWFEEGFAEYFSSIEVDSKEARVGKIPSYDYLVLQQVGTMRVADLMKVRQYSETYNESGNRRTTFYSESGMLMHYIYDNQLLPKVVVYFDLKENQHVAVEDALRRAFGMSAKQFDDALRDYIRVGHYKFYKIPTPASIAAGNFTSRPLNAADSSAVLADIHLHSRDYQDKALSEFQDILKSDPNNPAACRGLGYAYLQRQDFSHAGEYFKRASQLDSKDPRVHYYNALLMARQGGFSSGSDIPGLTEELETSIRLDPSFADSYALLAFAQTTSGDSAKALVTMQKALAIDPRNDNYRFNLANIYLANRQPDQATTVLQSLQNAANPELASRAAGALMNMKRGQPGQNTPPSNTPVFTLQHRGSDDRTTSSPDDAGSPSPTPATANVKWSAPTFLLGSLSSVDCSNEPSAVLTVLSGSKTLKLKIADKHHVIVIGADQLHCAWTMKKVAVNYRQGGTGETDVISLEIQ